ncbi:chondroitin AC/alginate lyase [Artomyces pyxidatus]|uniref:Chondroitin AC/alginate lyase n=1 Tax=Artomyces pyxidatus TaxID=48021 RepID=A0ACB8SZ00_9AGAM|nr:chondroitin AC/alginate lyase [Artomyces pyxidatus]
MRVITAVLSLLVGLPVVHSFDIPFTSYDDDFIDPKYVLAKSFNTNTSVSQQSIVQWADFLNAQGGAPWSVTTSKPFPAPSGDIHDYLSWSPYWWPNCTGVGNKTELTPQQIWTTCPYSPRDGLFNPDLSTIANNVAFYNMTDAILYNSLAWVINGSSTYSSNIATYIKTWFLDSDTKMNPNLNYAQVQRGPGKQLGTHTGVLDFKCMAKLVNAILILRQGKSPEWTSDIDTQLVAWVNTYLQWLETASIALQEAAATNNHGSYYYAQLASLKILVNDTAGAQTSLKKYFSTLYKNQISANGEQPLEAARTRPYHYRAYNLAAMITNARLAEYTGFSAWNLTTANGSTIKTALDYTMTVPPESDGASEILYSVGAVASVYGDPQGTYAAFLNKSEPFYPAEPWFFWDQPLSDSGWVRANAANSTGGGPGATSKPKSNSSAVRSSGHGWSATTLLTGFAGWIVFSLVI